MLATPPARSSSGDFQISRKLPHRNTSLPLRPTRAHLALFISQLESTAPAPRCLPFSAGFKRPQSTTAARAQRCSAGSLGSGRDRLPYLRVLRKVSQRSLCTNENANYKPSISLSTSIVTFCLLERLELGFGSASTIGGLRVDCC